MKPGKSTWPVLLALLVWAGLSGCRSLPPAPPPPPQGVASAEEVLAKLQSREQTLESFQARGRITFLSPQRNYSGTVLLKGRRPATLRLDILDLFGRTLLSFATDGNQVQVLSPSEGKFFHGPATPGNLATFVPPEVGLPQVLRLLVGALPLSSGSPSKFEYDSAAGQYRLEWQKNGIIQERLWVSAQGLYPVKEEYFGGGDRPRFTAELADFGEAAPDLPGKITLKTEAPKLELRLAYKELRSNPSMGPDDLALTAPAGVTVVQLP